MVVCGQTLRQVVAQLELELLRPCQFFSKIADKIERWGFCRKDCQDKQDGFMWTNLNILTDEECKTLFAQVTFKILISLLTSFSGLSG